MKKKALAAVEIILTLLLAACGVLWHQYHHRNAIYQKAIHLMDAGDLQSAYLLFAELGEFRNSKTQAATLMTVDPILPLRGTSKGDVVMLGRWEQDNDPENGSEPIEWLVLDRIDNHLLLLSMKCIDGGAYHTDPFAEVTWEDSDMRSRLNHDFFTTAFSDDEKLFIPEVQNSNADQSVVGTEGGNDTSDRVFLLSETEIRIYLNDEFARDSIGKTYATEYAVAHGVEIDGEGYASWWLRSPGIYPYSAQFVDQNGSLYLSGAYTDVDYQFGIRPAIWISLAD